ncbi:MAG TPA: hypothetical protein VF700_05770, partial [Segetibacter sp.]
MSQINKFSFCEHRPVFHIRVRSSENINHFSPQNITLSVQNKVKKQADRTDDQHYKIEWRDK